MASACVRQALVDGDLMVLGLGRAGEQHVVDHRASALDVGLALLLDALDRGTGGVVGISPEGREGLLEVCDLRAGLVLWWRKRRSSSTLRAAWTLSSSISTTVCSILRAAPSLKL